MTDLAKMTVIEAKLFFRDTSTWMVSLVLPTAILVVLGSIHIPGEAGVGVSPATLGAANRASAPSRQTKEMANRIVTTPLLGGEPGEPASWRARALPRGSTSDLERWR